MLVKTMARVATTARGRGTDHRIVSAIADAIEPAAITGNRYRMASRGKGVTATVTRHARKIGPTSHTPTCAAERSPSNRSTNNGKASIGRIAIGTNSEPPKPRTCHHSSLPSGSAAPSVSGEETLVANGLAVSSNQTPSTAATA